MLTYVCFERHDNVLALGICYWAQTVYIVHSTAYCSTVEQFRFAWCASVSTGGSCQPAFPLPHDKVIPPYGMSATP